MTTPQPIKTTSFEQKRVSFAAQLEVSHEPCTVGVGCGDHNGNDKEEGIQILSPVSSNVNHTAVALEEKVLISNLAPCPSPNCASPSTALSMPPPPPPPTCLPQFRPEDGVDLPPPHIDEKRIGAAVAASEGLGSAGSGTREREKGPWCFIDTLCAHKDERRVVEASTPTNATTTINTNENNSQEDKENYVDAPGEKFNLGLYSSSQSGSILDNGDDQNEEVVEDADAIDDDAFLPDIEDEAFIPPKGQDDNDEAFFPPGEEEGLFHLEDPEGAFFPQDESAFLPTTTNEPDAFSEEHEVLLRESGSGEVNCQQSGKEPEHRDRIGTIEPPGNQDMVEENNSITPKISNQEDTSSSPSKVGGSTSTDSKSSHSAWINAVSASVQRVDSPKKSSSSNGKGESPLRVSQVGSIPASELANCVIPSCHGVCPPSPGMNNPPALPVTFPPIAVVEEGVRNFNAVDPEAFTLCDSTMSENQDIGLNKNGSQEEEINTLRRNASQAEEEIHELRIQLAQSKEETNRAVSEAVKKIEMRLRKDSQQEVMKVVQSAKIAHSAQLKSTTKAHSRREEQLQKEKKEQVLKIAGAMKVATAVKKEFEAEENFGELKTLRNSLGNLLKNQKATIESLQKSVDEKDKEIFSLQKEKKTATEGEAAAKASLKVAEKTLITLKGELSQTRAKLRTAEKDLAETKKANVALLSSVDVLTLGQQDRDTLKSANESLEQHRAKDIELQNDLEMLVKTLQRENKEMRSVTNCQSGELLERACVISDLKDSLAFLQEEAKAAKTLRVENIAMKNHIQQQEASIGLMKADIHIILESVQMADGEKDELIRSLSYDCQSLRMALSSRSKGGESVISNGSESDSGQRKAPTSSTIANDDHSERHKSKAFDTDNDFMSNDGDNHQPADEDQRKAPTNSTIADEDRQQLESMVFAVENDNTSDRGDNQQPGDKELAGLDTDNTSNRGNNQQITGADIKGQTSVKDQSGDHLKSKTGSSGDGSMEGSFQVEGKSDGGVMGNKESVQTKASEDVDPIFSCSGSAGAFSNMSSIDKTVDTEKNKDIQDQINPIFSMASKENNSESVDEGHHLTEEDSTINMTVVGQMAQQQMQEASERRRTKQASSSFNCLACGCYGPSNSLLSIQEGDGDGEGASVGDATSVGDVLSVTINDIEGDIVEVAKSPTACTNQSNDGQPIESPSSVESSSPDDKSIKVVLEGDADNDIHEIEAILNLSLQKSESATASETSDSSNKEGDPAPAPCDSTNQEGDPGPAPYDSTNKEGDTTSCANKNARVAPCQEATASAKDTVASDAKDVGEITTGASTVKVDKADTSNKKKDSDQVDTVKTAANQKVEGNQVANKTSLTVNTGEKSQLPLSISNFVEANVASSPLAKKLGELMSIVSAKPQAQVGMLKLAYKNFESEKEKIFKKAEAEKRRAIEEMRAKLEREKQEFIAEQERRFDEEVAASVDEDMKSKQAMQKEEQPKTSPQHVHQASTNKKPEKPSLQIDTGNAKAVQGPVKRSSSASSLVSKKGPQKQKNSLTVSTAKPQRHNASLRVATGSSTAKQTAVDSSKPKSTMKQTQKPPSGLPGASLNRGKSSIKSTGGPAPRVPKKPNNSKPVKLTKPSVQRKPVSKTNATSRQSNLRPPTPSAAAKRGTQIGKPNVSSSAKPKASGAGTRSTNPTVNRSNETSKLPLTAAAGSKTSRLSQPQTKLPTPTARGLRQRTQQGETKKSNVERKVALLNQKGETKKPSNVESKVALFSASASNNGKRKSIGKSIVTSKTPEIDQTLPANAAEPLSVSTTFETQVSSRLITTSSLEDSLASLMRTQEVIKSPKRSTNSADSKKMDFTAFPALEERDDQDSVSSALQQEQDVREGGQAMRASETSAQRLCKEETTTKKGGAKFEAANKGNEEEEEDAVKGLETGELANKDIDSVIKESSKPTQIHTAQKPAEVRPILKEEESVDQEAGHEKLDLACSKAKDEGNPTTQEEVVESGLNPELQLLKAEISGSDSDLE